MDMNDSVESMLDCAKMLNGIFGTFIEGVAVRPNYAGFIAVDPIGVAAFPELDEQISEQARESRRTFEDGMRKRGLSCGWSAHEPLTEAATAGYARAFDISVLGRPSNRENGPRMSLFESVLFESGRPILIAPPTPPKSLGKTVLVAWNQSSETATCTGLAMPFLEKANRVIVLTVEGAVVPGAAGVDLVTQLKRSGIPAEERTVAPGSRTAGEKILDEVQAHGVDLLVKGAYTQSRIRQMIFGGMTSHILANANVPVFMSH
jgi:nucleotide-binding universal stress UspA family protein